MLDRILLPLDHSALAECVLPHAAAFARAFNSKLTLLHVMDTSQHVYWRNAVDPLSWEVRKAEAKNYLHGLALRLQKAGVSAEEEVLDGEVALQITEYARARGIDLIMLSRQGESGMSDFNVGSVVHKIVQAASTSIMIVRPQLTAPAGLANLSYSRIFVPVDGSRRAEFILPLANLLAHAHRAQLLLAHVVERPEMPRRTPAAREDIQLAEQLVERNRLEAAQYLEELQSQLDVDLKVRVLVSDHVAAALHELVDQEKVDLVLLSAHGYSGQTRWPYGSVVGNLIAYGTAPLFIAQDFPHDLPHFLDVSAVRQHEIPLNYAE